MTTRTDRRAAALLLRLAAQIVSGEDTTILGACKWPLREMGFDIGNIEDAAEQLQRDALKAIAAQGILSDVE
jgi:hypothetical protein